LTNVTLSKDKEIAEQQVGGLKSGLDQANRAISELTDLKMHLEAENSQLRSQLELTTSSKDKIIIKLRNEI
jgi:hypothetical protein